MAQKNEKINVRFDRQDAEQDEWIALDSPKLRLLTELEIEERKAAMEDLGIDSSLARDKVLSMVSANSDVGSATTLLRNETSKDHTATSKRKPSSQNSDVLVRELFVAHNTGKISLEASGKRRKINSKDDDLTARERQSSEASTESTLSSNDLSESSSSLSPMPQDEDRDSPLDLDTEEESVSIGSDEKPPPVEKPVVETTLGYPIHLGLPPVDIVQFKYEDEESEIRRILLRVLDSGLIVNKIVEEPPEEILRTNKKPGTENGDEKDGAEHEDDSYKRLKTKEKFVAILEARQEALITRRGTDVPLVEPKPVSEKEMERIREIRLFAVRNLCHSPMMQFVRQVIYNEEDRRDALNNSSERSKSRAAKVLSVRKPGIGRPGSLSSRILGISGEGASDLLFNEAGYIESTKPVVKSQESQDIEKAKQKQRKLAKLMKERRLVKSMLELHQSQKEQETMDRTFQSLRSLTRPNTKKRITVDDHITFLRQTLVPGTRIRARDKQLEWLTALIEDVRNSRVLVHYEGYHAVYNEWIDINSERLQYDPTLEQPNPTAQIDSATAEKESESIAGTQDDPDLAIQESVPLVEHTGDKDEHTSTLLPPDDSEVVENPSASAAELMDLVDVVPEEEAAIEVNCIQCRVKISQFR